MWWFLHVSIIFHCVQSVRIVNMRVPEVVQFGTKDAITLDCDYVLDNVTGLVVKWFYMDKSQPVYQWIPPQKPQALGILRDKLDLTYKASHNPYTQHRALRMLAPDPQLTGNYTCVVSTFLAEDQRTKPLTIFVPERRFDMILDRLDGGWLNIICSAEGLYPKPDIIILAGNRPLSAKTNIKYMQSRFTALASMLIKIESLPPTVEIMCELQVPLANYLSRKRDIFYRDPPEPEVIASHTQTSPDSGNAVKASQLLLISSLALFLVRSLSFQT